MNKSDLFLAYSFSKRELLTRHKGSILGFIWVFLSPLLLLALYSAIFQYIFHAKWDVGEQTSNYTIALFCGLSPYFFITEVMGKSSELIKNNGNLVKKVIFNRIVLPFSSTSSSAFILLINFILIIIATKVLDDHFSFFSLVSILYILPIFLIGFGISLILSSIGAYFKDLSNIIAFVNPVLMFVSPIFFSPEKVNPLFASFINYNPLSIIIIGIRDIILDGFFNLSNFILLNCIGLCLVLIGYFLFRRLEEDFSDLV